MNLGAVVSKRSVLVASLVAIVASVGALLHFTNRSRESAPSIPGDAGHAAESRTSGTAAATDGAASGDDSSRRIRFYRSTMLPNEVSATPRKDSMGMEMVPVYESAGSMLELSEHARAMAGVETVAVRRRPMSREIRVVGKVQYNETTLANITTRVEGYVERLFVDYTGVEVSPGDHLVEIYSPDLVVAQQELLIALESQRNASLVESARGKLLRWGLTEAQIDDLVRDKKVSDRITLFSPIRGTVTEKRVVWKAMVKPGEMLYRLANLDSVWVYLDIYEFELSWVQYGQVVEITAEAFPGRSFSGRVWFISPVLDEATRTVKVLLNIDNSERHLKPGMYVSAVIRADLLADGSPAPTGVEGQWTCPMHPLVVQPHAGQCPICKMRLVQIPGTPAAARAGGDSLILAVPVSAVLDSGVRKLVYVEQAKGEFVPVEVVTGPRTDDFYPVLSGLDEGDRVAVRGSFLLDSQIQIRGLPSLFYPQGQAAPVGHQHGSADPLPSATEKRAGPHGHEQHVD